MSSELSDAMRCVCAWCDLELPTVPCIETQADKITHGICPECAVKNFGQLSAPDERPALDLTSP